MRSIIIILLASLLFEQAGGQKLIASNPAKLQVYLMNNEGKEIVAACNALQVNYHQLNMSGVLEISLLSSDDPELTAILENATIKQVSFSTMIAQEQFIFHNTLNNLFSTEADIITGEHQSRIILNFDLSNQKTSSTNTFSIICQGVISLRDDLGILIDTGFDDKVSFRFYQNVRSLN